MKAKVWHRSLPTQLFGGVRKHRHNKYCTIRTKSSCYAYALSKKGNHESHGVTFRSLQNEHWVISHSLKVNPNQPTVSQLIHIPFHSSPVMCQALIDLWQKKTSCFTETPRVSHWKNKYFLKSKEKLSAISARKKIQIWWGVGRNCTVLQKRQSGNQISSVVAEGMGNTTITKWKWEERRKKTYYTTSTSTLLHRCHQSSVTLLIQSLLRSSKLVWRGGRGFHKLAS